MNALCNQTGRWEPGNADADAENISRLNSRAERWMNRFVYPVEIKTDDPLYVSFMGVNSGLHDIGETAARIAYGKTHPEAHEPIPSDYADRVRAFQQAYSEFRDRARIHEASLPNPEMAR